MYFVLREAGGEWFYGGEEANKFYVMEPVLVKEIHQALVFRCRYEESSLLVDKELPKGDFIPVAVSISVTQMK